MKWLRLLVLVGLAAGVVAVLVIVGPLRARTTDAARQYLERALAAALHAPVAIGALRVTLLPPRVEAEAVAIGENGALVRAAHVTLQLLPRTSLRQRRPVGEATADEVTIDIPGWLALPPSTEPPAPAALPPFRLRALHVTQAHVGCGGAVPLDVDAGVLDGAFEVNTGGQVHFLADLQHVALARRGTTLQLVRARVEGGETPQGWRLTAIDVLGDGVQLASTAAQPDRLPIRGHVALSRLTSASEAFERLGGEVEVDAALIGPLDTPAATGRLALADLTVDGERLGAVKVRAEWTRERLTVSALRLAAFGGEAEGRGELTLTAPFAYSARLRGSSLAVRDLAHLEGPMIKPSTANGHVELSGTLEPLVVQIEGRGTLVGAPATAPAAWHGRGGYQAGAGTAELDIAQGRDNSLGARLAIAPQGGLNGSLDVGVRNPTALGAFLPVESVPRVGGSLTASAEVGGAIDDPGLSGRLSGRDLALLGVNIENLSGAFAVDRRAFRTAGISAKLGQGSIDLTGTIALEATGENDWQMRVDNTSGDAIVAMTSALTGTVVPIGRGTLAVHLAGRGSWAHSEITGDAEMTQFWLGSQWIQQATLRGAASWPHWQLDGVLRNGTGQTVEAHGSGTATTDVAIRANSSGWELTALQRDERGETGGRVMLDASLAGPLRGLHGHAAVQARGVVLRGRRVGAIDVDATATAGRWQLTTTLLDGALTLRSALSPDAGWPFSVEGTWTDARVGRLLVSGGDVEVESTGALQLSGRLTAVEQLEATLRVQSLRVANGPYDLATAQPAVLVCRRGACTLDGLTLQGADTELRVSGTMTTSGALGLTVTGQGDLRALELAGGAIESARGRFTVDVTVRRAAGLWDVAGQISLDDAALDVGAPMAITRARGRFSLAGATVRIDQLGGRMGTGTFEIDGSVDLQHGPDLSWALTGVGADLLPSLEAELSGRGTLTGPWDQMRLVGQVDIARMLYDRDIELTDFLPTLNRALAEAPHPPSAQRFELDLRVAAPGQLFVENNVAQVEARADLHVSGPPDRPVLDGRIEVLDGQVTFRDRVFELQGGTADLRPDLGLTAALNIGAESTIDTPDATYVVAVRVTGTTADPRVTLSSDDPSLTQTDLATLIALGKTTAQMRQSGGSYSFGMQQSTKQLLPIDRISFESTYSSTTGTFEPQIKLGKDLTDNLAVSVGRTFGVEARTLAEADYRLTPHIYVPLSWESQTSNQQGAFAGGLKVRYEFWRVTPFTLLGGLH